MLYHIISYYNILYLHNQDGKYQILLLIFIPGYIDLHDYDYDDEHERDTHMHIHTHTSLSLFDVDGFVAMEGFMFMLIFHEVKQTNAIQLIFFIFSFSNACYVNINSNIQCLIHLCMHLRLRRCGVA